MPVMIDFHTTAPFYCLPIVDIGGVRVGWHHTGPVIQPDDERVIPAPILEGMKGWIERVFPHLDRQPVDIQTCLYTTTPDKHFVLDRHPKHSHVVIAAACSGHAFKFGPILGELLAGLVMEETLPLSLATFALSRFEDVLTQG